MKIGPVRPLPVPMLSVSSDELLVAMLMVELASLSPVAMFNTEPFLAIPEKTNVVEPPLVSPPPRLNIPPVLVFVAMFMVGALYDV